MILQTANIAYPKGIVQVMTVNIVIPFHVELVMVTVTPELARLVMFVGIIISWSSIHFFLTVLADIPKMQKFVLNKVFYCKLYPNYGSYSMRDTVPNCTLQQVTYKFSFVFLSAT